MLNDCDGYTGLIILVSLLLCMLENFQNKKVKSKKNREVRGKGGGLKKKWHEKAKINPYREIIQIRNVISLVREKEIGGENFISQKLKKLRRIINL